eukprot:TRINITY_DN660_c0_g1_i1.p1 TRINITY_DN660_c0_g1~~TRINITY_DN660_c0_g1_i1.p1  ORF type:complete len:451 (+),score=41.10 TRINITY_DN660_c0_g1_i1:2098-3450(+)
MNPKFLAAQLEQSRQNLGLETIDLLYLHNPYEMHGPLTTPSKFMEKLHKAFEFLERMVQANYIKHYGLATYLCFRAPPSESQIHLSLQSVVKAAENVAGTHGHHFKFIQAPINIAMPEAMTEAWQELHTGKEKSEHVLLAAANRLSVNLVSCQPLFQGKVVKLKLPQKLKFEDRGAGHLQLIRSIPARCLVSTLVGMKTLPHVKANLEVVRIDPLPESEFISTIQAISLQPIIKYIYRDIHIKMEKVSTSDKKFISFILNYICDNKAIDMRVQLEDLSKYMLTLEPKCEPNLFRKQYGNLKTCFKLPGVEKVFFLDNNLVKFQPGDKIKHCKDVGIISEADYTKYLKGMDTYWTQKLTVTKSLAENVCKTCGSSYKVSVNAKGLCKDGEAHVPKYDWSKSPDVLKCEIKQPSSIVRELHKKIRFSLAQLNGNNNKNARTEYEFKYVPNFQ